MRVIRARYEDTDRWGENARGADAVVHLAGQTTLSEIGSDVREFQSTGVNVSGLCEFMHKTLIPRLVFASSAAVYGLGGTDEKEALYPINTYGHAKAIAEQIIRGYAEWCGGWWKARVLRFFNVYGPDPWPHRHDVISQFVEAARYERPMRVFVPDKTHQYYRDFVHVDDVVKAILWAITADVGVYQAYNVCAGDSYNIGTVAKRIQKWGAERGYDWEVTMVEHPDGRQVGSSFGLVGKLDRGMNGAWKPIDLKTGLADLLAGAFPKTCLRVVYMV